MHFGPFPEAGHIKTWQLFWASFVPGTISNRCAIRTFLTLIVHANPPNYVLHSVAIKVRLRVRLKSIKGEIAPVVISSSVKPAFGPETELEEKWKRNRQRSAENALANESEIRRLCRKGLSVDELARTFRTTRLLIVCICRSGDLKWACERYILGQTRAIIGI
jgi:hypothetical protein